MLTCLIIVVRARTEFWVGRPGGARLEAFLARHADAKPNWPPIVKSTLSPGVPSGFCAKSMTRRIEGGDFAKAKRAALAWSGKSDYFVAGNGDLATCAKTYFPGVWVVNPVRETYRVDGPRHAAVAYTTLDGHLLQGEERLAVERDGEDVVANIVSVSRGNGVPGRLVYPFVGPMRRRFFQAQLDAIERASLD